MQLQGEAFSYRCLGFGWHRSAADPLGRIREVICRWVDVECVRGGNEERQLKEASDPHHGDITQLSPHCSLGNVEGSRSVVNGYLEVEVV